MIQISAEGRRRHFFPSYSRVSDGSPARRCRSVPAQPESREDCAHVALAPQGLTHEEVADLCADLRAVPWHLDATAVYVANLLFPPCLDAAVCRRLAESGTVDRVATLKPLEGLPGAAHLAHVGRLRVPFSWAARGHLYVYERRRRRVDS